MQSYFFYSLFHLLCRISGTSIFIIMIFRSFQPRLIISFRFFCFVTFFLSLSLSTSLFRIFCLQFHFSCAPFFITIIITMVSFELSRIVSYKMREWDCIFYIMLFYLLCNRCCFSFCSKLLCRMVTLQMITWSIGSYIQKKKERTQWNVAWNPFNTYVILIF